MMDKDFQKQCAFFNCAEGLVVISNEIWELHVSVPGLTVDVAGRCVIMSHGRSRLI
jgi:hypothetical protein